MVFNATFNNMSVISWRLVLLTEETRVPRENHRPAASPWQSLLHNVVSNTPRLCGNSQRYFVVIGIDSIKIIYNAVLIDIGNFKMKKKCFERKIDRKITMRQSRTTIHPVLWICKQTIHTCWWINVRFLIKHICVCAMDSY